MHFDDYAYRLYKEKDPNLLNLTTLPQFHYRIYTHSKTNLCPVYNHLLRNSDIDTAIPSCLRCLANTLKYSKDKYLQSLILKSVVLYYEEGPRLQSIIQKNLKNHDLIYEFGEAIIQFQGIFGVFDTYTRLIDIETAVKLQKHPLLHKLLLEDEILKNGVYRMFRQRKRVFYEELYAKAWHPSRFMQWCYTEDEKTFDIPTYVFKNPAPWNIEW